MMEIFMHIEGCFICEKVQGVLLIYKLLLIVTFL